jgi:DNA-binding MarR family transcriptional regulator
LTRVGISSTYLTINWRTTIVKQLDEKTYPPLIDHIGWRLWRASLAWKADLESGMVARGFPWFGEAFLGPQGVKQSSLGPKLGMTKQAVQQFVDELVRDGIVRRVPDPDDRRGRLILLTDDGLHAMTVANDVKQRIQAEYREVLGAGDLDRLMTSLEKLSGNKSRAGK